MIASLLARCLNRRTIIVFDSNAQLGIPQFASSLPSKPFGSKTLSQKPNELSFTVSYLVNSCGLSLDSAKSASRKVHFEAPERPDLILNFLREHGFNNAHISRIIKERPTLLMTNAEKLVFPKFEFFHSVGISSNDIVEIFSSNPVLFGCSLEKCIVPCYDTLKEVLIFDEKVVRSLKRTRWSLNQKNLSSNMALLRSVGLRQSGLSYLLCFHPATLFSNPSKFEGIVEEVKQMGFDPLKSVFIQAIHVLSYNSRSAWESKFEVYGKLGWSRDDTLAAFKMYPYCMCLTDKKIMSVMEYLVKEMGWPSKAVAKYPTVLSMSLEKRIIPRCSVVQVLLLNDLIKEDVSLATVMSKKEEYFLKKFVTKFEDRVPQLLKLYREKLDLSTNGMK